LRGLEWTDYKGDALNVCRSIWETVVNRPKTSASAKPVPVIRQLAELLDGYRISIFDGEPGNWRDVSHRRRSAHGIWTNGPAGHTTSRRSAFDSVVLTAMRKRKRPSNAREPRWNLCL